MDSSTSTSAVVAQALRDEDVSRTEDGQLLFDPYNPANREITAAEVQAILARYGVPAQIHNLNLYRRAFVHRSYTKRPEYENAANHILVAPPPSPDCLPLKTKSNERLEFLGDGVLECVVKFHLYRRFPKEDEGFMTEKKIAIVKNVSIGKVAHDMGLHQWLIVSRTAEENGMRSNLKKLGCLFEAFVGALFLDANQVPDDAEEEAKPTTGKRKFGCGEEEENDANNDASVEGEEFVDFWSKSHTKGFHVALRFIENVFKEHIDWVGLLLNDDNYKAILQVKIQKEFKLTPHYLEVAPRDDTYGYHMGVFLCIGQSIHALSPADALSGAAAAALNTFAAIQNYLDYNGGRIFLLLGRGNHKNKRKAEQWACKEALAFLQ